MKNSTFGMMVHEFYTVVPQIHFTQLLLVKPYQTPQIFLIYEGDPRLSPGGEASPRGAPP